jgi:hypothetical protein
MISRPLVRASLVASLSACAAHSSPVAIAPGSAPAAVANTSIATARPLVAGDVIDLILPCTGKVYFGPARFTAEGQHLSLATEVRSASGAQVCGGGGFVDGDDAQQQVGGTGCVEGDQPYAATLDYAYTPGAGGPGANPIYLAQWTATGVGDAVTTTTCDALRLHLEVKAAP